MPVSQVQGKTVIESGSIALSVNETTATISLPQFTLTIEFDPNEAGAQANVVSGNNFRLVMSPSSNNRLMAWEGTISVGSANYITRVHVRGLEQNGGVAHTVNYTITA